MSVHISDLWAKSGSALKPFPDFFMINAPAGDTVNQCG